jgi:hypothetical protein
MPMCIDRKHARFRLMGPKFRVLDGKPVYPLVEQESLFLEYILDSRFRGNDKYSFGGRTNINEINNVALSEPGKKSMPPP